jgi:hypothetical protein
MFKVLWLLKRKPGISFEQFRDHYENTHSVLGKKYFGHLMLSYERHYDRAKEADGKYAAYGLASSGYDCVAEWGLRDEAAFGEFLAIMADPATAKIFKDDELNFLDSAETRAVLSDCRDTGTGH